MITTLFKKGLTANLLRKGLIENGGVNFKRLIPNPIGVITTLFKKGLTENSCLI
ncbi:MAG: hypothetical protein ACOX79_08160 [Methanosarcina sp.]